MTGAKIAPTTRTLEASGAVLTYDSRRSSLLTVAAGPRWGLAVDQQSRVPLRLGSSSPRWTEIPARRPFR